MHLLRGSHGQCAAQCLPELRRRIRNKNRRSGLAITQLKVRYSCLTHLLTTRRDTVSTGCVKTVRLVVDAFRHYAIDPSMLLQRIGRTVSPGETSMLIAQSVALFLLAGLFEIGGGYLV